LVCGGNSSLDTRLSFPLELAAEMCALPLSVDYFSSEI
jgi:hypothetical protein